MMVALLVGASCSGNDTAGRESTRSSPEGTLSSPPAPETTAAPTSVGGTTGTSEPDAVLRLEGDPETTFSGICTNGSEESVIGGRVPKLYRFELNGRELSCRIQKQNRESGTLRVVLLSGDNTRSVQQTSSTDSVIRLSYTG